MTDRADSAPSGVLAFSENADLASELLTVGRSLAAGAKLTSLLVGAALRERAEDAIARGANEAVLVRPPDGARLGAETCLAALHAAVLAQRPAVVLVGSTRTGVEVAARLGQRLRVGCITDALSLEIDDGGGLVATRRVLGGHFLGRVANRSTPAIATVPSKRFEPPPRDDSRRGRTSEMPIQLPPPLLRTLAIQERPRSEVDIRKAAVVVAVGRGVKRQEDVALVAALAEALGGALAGTRPITDDLRWLPPDRKIGLSGLSVRPTLYVACGISGQIEHVVGMRAARTVIAINSDPGAPIHAEADYSVVGDLYLVVPALAAALRHVRRRQAAATMDGLP